MGVIPTHSLPIAPASFGASQRQLINFWLGEIRDPLQPHPLNHKVPQRKLFFHPKISPSEPFLRGPFFDRPSSSANGCGSELGIPGKPQVLVLFHVVWVPGPSNMSLQVGLLPQNDGVNSLLWVVPVLFEPQPDEVEKNFGLRDLNHRLGIHLCELLPQKEIRGNVTTLRVMTLQ